ncbi:hypothetical protein KQI42_15705 [Tissierella sp. MSJ-40]|uniref:Uncharacterized protein n=1 Tax=Tissierella simiarum TaxID=2841534 RepID=A0ABS6E959_9FIRM|nr:hypothetical protein [Tissierella simiarum]MBU5439460.1 hypothetical protein [Tissierella simiarum]
MEVALVTVTIDRNTGKTINKEVKEVFEVDEDEFYRPLIKVLGDDFIRRWKGGELG